MLNVFGFDSERRYGLAKNLVNVSMTLQQALKYADIDAPEIPPEVTSRWKRKISKAGFTSSVANAP